MTFDFGSKKGTSKLTLGTPINNAMMSRRLKTPTNSMLQAIGMSL